MRLEPYKRALFVAVFLVTFVALGRLWYADTDAPRVAEPTPVTKSHAPEDGQLAVWDLDVAGAVSGRAGSTEIHASDDASPPSSGDGVLIEGGIETEYGGAVPGENIELYSESLQRRYTAVSDSRGEFVFEGVLPASDYQVSVSPERQYRYYHREGINIDADGAALTIVLDALRAGTLKGEILTPRGQPVPGLRIAVHSRHGGRGRLYVRSDEAGLFEVENFPEGPFEVQTRDQSVRITGLLFEPDANEVIPLVVDYGSYEISGRVFDYHGRPVDSAAAVLTWVHDHDGVRSTSQRLMRTDDNGGFSMSGLAYGVHELVIAPIDGPALKQNVVVGEAPAEMVVYLEGEGTD